MAVEIGGRIFTMGGGSMRGDELPRWDGAGRTVDHGGRGGGSVRKHVT